MNSTEEVKGQISGADENSLRTDSIVQKVAQQECTAAPLPLTTYEGMVPNKNFYDFSSERQTK